MTTSITKTLRERFGLRTLRPQQKAIIEQVMGGGHALVVLPTGSGKSLCYQLPALAWPEPGVTLVFSPLIALMEDQVTALKAKGIKAAYINSTLSRRERDQRCRQLARGRYEIIYATPERMTKPEFLEALHAGPGGVALIAVDEAHCISKWGHDLRPAYRDVGRFRKQLGSPPVIALTATATPAVRRDIRRTLGIDERQMPLFAAPIDRPNLTLESRSVWDDDEKIEHLQEILAHNRGRGTGIVYFARIMDLDRLAGRLRKTIGDRTIATYHGQLSPRQKKIVYNKFIKAKPEDGLVLFATNAFGMGVDKADIRFIVHAQIPASVEAYHQEVGRAGRDGRPARCILLYAEDDLAIQQQFVEWMNPTAGLLWRAAHAIEDSPHADFDADELHVLVSGKGRGDWRAQIEYAVIALAKRGVIEPTSIIDRYRFVRPLRDAEVDDKAVDRKRERDLRRLLDVVKLTKSRDIAAFVNRYFDLDERDARSKKTRRRRGGRRRKKKTTQTHAEPATKKTSRRGRRGRGGRKKAATTTASASPPAATSAGGKKKRRRRRRRRRRREDA